MTTQEARAVLEVFQQQARAICEIAKVAGKHRKSLSGQNSYGERFHEAVVTLSTTETHLSPLLASAGMNDAESEAFMHFIEILKSHTSSVKQRNDAFKQLRMVCQTSILSALENQSGNPVPKSEQVLPLDVVRPTRRKYLERIVTQANGTYENQWYDACGVMIRRLVETLIIELYEAKGRDSEIKDIRTSEFMMLGGLVDTCLADKSWNLMRETKKTLPEIKILGDRSAHARRYNTTKQDVEKVISGLRIVVDDLLHLSGLK